MGYTLEQLSESLESLLRYANENTHEYEYVHNTLTGYSLQLLSIVLVEAFSCENIPQNLLKNYIMTLQTMIVVYSTQLCLESKIQCSCIIMSSETYTILLFFC